MRNDESNKSVSDGDTEFETTLKVGPSSPGATCLLLYACWMVVVCDPEPSGFTTKEKSSCKGHSIFWTVTISASCSWRLVVMDEMVVFWVMFCTNTVFVMLKSCRLENWMSCCTLVWTRP